MPHGETNKLSLLDSREHKTRVTVFPRARARARMHRPARETLRLAVFDSERARVRSSRLLRASEREREPQEREREKERASSRATLVQKVSETTQDDCCCLFLVCGRKKRRKKSQKRWTEGGLYYLRRKAKESSTFVHGHKNLPLFFCLLQRRARLWKKKGGFVVGVGKNWLGNFR